MAQLRAAREPIKMGQQRITAIKAGPPAAPATKAKGGKVGKKTN